VNTARKIEISITVKILILIYAKIYTTCNVIKKISAIQTWTKKDCFGFDPCLMLDTQLQFIVGINTDLSTFFLEFIKKKTIGSTQLIQIKLNLNKLSIHMV